jgi:predicted Holliday junction resolvase-like endonuclease
VLTKWHITLDYILISFVVLVIFFAIFILYVVTHITENQVSELKATIKSQAKELRKFRRKRDEVRQKLLFKRTDGPKVVEGSAEEMGYGTIDEQIVYNRAMLERIRRVGEYLR